MEKERMERAVRQPLTKEEALVGRLSSGGFVRDKRVTQTKSARDPMKGSSFFFFERDSHLCEFARACIHFASNHISH